MRIIDTTAFEWSTSYGPNAAEYRYSDVVKEYYNSSFTAPSSLDPTLAEVSGARGGSTTSTTGSTQTSTSAGTSGGPTKSNGSNTGAIAGAVVGGVVGLTGIALALFCLRRRHNRKTSSQVADPSWQAEAGDEHADAIGAKSYGSYAMSENPSQIIPRQELSGEPRGSRVKSGFHEIPQ